MVEVKAEWLWSTQLARAVCIQRLGGLHTPRHCLRGTSARKPSAPSSSILQMAPTLGAPFTCGEFHCSWVIVQNRPGEVFSAEVETGTTPLLLSIPALIALDAVIHMREKRINLRSLGVELPLRETRTKHLAMMVSYNPCLGIAKDVEGSPKATSINQDLFVYYSEEASLPVLTDEPMVEVPVSEDYAADCSPPQLGQGAFEKMTSLVSLVTAEVLSWPMP